MPPRRSQRGGAVPANQQPYTPGVVEVIGDLRQGMIHDHLYTIPREFNELTVENKLRPIVPVGLDFLENLHPGNKLYGVQQHEGQFIFYKYQVHSVTDSVVDGRNFTYVALINIRYIFSPDTGAPLELYLYPNFGKFLICDRDTNTSHLHEQIQGTFYPRPHETLFYVSDAPAPAPA